MPSCSTTLPASQSNSATSRRSALPRSIANSYGCNPSGVMRPRLSTLPRAVHDQRGEPARLADRRDAVAVAGVLEAIRRVADHEALRAEEHLVGEVEARRQRDRRRRGRLRRADHRRRARSRPLRRRRSLRRRARARPRGVARARRSVVAGLLGAVMTGGCVDACAPRLARGGLQHRHALRDRGRLG